MTSFSILLLLLLLKFSLIGGHVVSSSTLSPGQGCSLCAHAQGLKRWLTPVAPHYYYPSSTRAEPRS